MADEQKPRMQAERLKYPGLLPREIIILRTWLLAHELEYDRFEYNVRVGAGVDPGPQWPENIRKQAIENTQKRIDAVAYKGDSATIIEVKDRAGASAIGQLLTYLPLFEEAFPAYKSPAMILITNRVQPDLLPVLERAGIRLDLVAADFSELAPRGGR